MYQSTQLLSLLIASISAASIGPRSAPVGRVAYPDSSIIYASCQAPCVIKKNESGVYATVDSPQKCPSSHAKQPAGYSDLLEQVVNSESRPHSFTVVASTGAAVVPATQITGNVGVSPVAITYVTGFSLQPDIGGESSYMVKRGLVYGADSSLKVASSAVSYMNTAYNNAQSVSSFPTDFSECATGNLDNLLLTPGVYSWSTAVGLSATSTVTLIGTNSDPTLNFFILRAAGAFTFGAQSRVTLYNVPIDNVFWVGSTNLSVGSGAYFQGISLTYTNVVIAVNAIINGRILTQTEVAIATGTILRSPECINADITGGSLASAMGCIPRYTPGGTD